MTRSGSLGTSGISEIMFFKAEQNLSDTRCSVKCHNPELKDKRLGGGLKVEESIGGMERSVRERDKARGSELERENGERGAAANINKINRQDQYRARSKN